FQDPATTATYTLSLHDALPIFAGEREYIFKHILTRDVAYESLPRRDRAAAHAEVAAWIEETTGERQGEFVELLAHHYAEAFRSRSEEHTSELQSRGHLVCRLLL